MDVASGAVILSHKGTVTVAAMMSAVERSCAPMGWEVQGSCQESTCGFSHRRLGVLLKRISQQIVVGSGGLGAVRSPQPSGDSDPAHSLSAQMVRRLPQPTPR